MIHIVVLHWGAPSVTAMCLRSLQCVTTPNVEVVVIDNGTPDRGGDSLKHDFPEFTHIRSDTNLGFAGGNNLGMQRALDTQADFVVLLNNDAEVEPHFLDSLIIEALQFPNTGLLNPKILYADPKDKIWFSHGEHSLWAGLFQCVDRYEIDDPDESGSISMTVATGCALMISREALEKVGLLDDSLFMYAEDLDYSIRVRRAGLTIRNVRESRVYHHEPVQRKKAVADSFRLHLTTRNLVRVEIKHARPWHHLTFWPWFLLRWMTYLSLKNIALGFPRDAAALWLGLWDGIRGKCGKPQVIFPAKVSKSD